MIQPRSMACIGFTEVGDPGVLNLETAPVPAIEAGDVLIRVEAAGINRPDILQRRGLYPVPPDANPRLGLEVAGEVVALGAGAQGFKVGDKVCALTNGGGYAQFASAPAGQVLPWPAGYNAVQAACLPETYFTVWANLFQMGRLQAGETVLLHGGASGIGTTAIQLAREFGAHPWVTVGQDSKRPACERLGAEVVINHNTQDFQQVIAQLTAGAGVDVILDIIGAAYLSKNLASLAMDGRLILLGFMGGAIAKELNLAQIMLRRLSITGSAMRPRSHSEKALIAASLLERVWPVLNAGRCAPLIHEVFPMSQVAQAHRLMESSTHMGKIVLTMD